MTRKGKFDMSQIWTAVREELSRAGIDVDFSGHPDSCCHEGGKGTRVKLVCVTPGLKDSKEEMSKTPRDQVVMVRIDEETSKSLDDWVESGAAKSRSEAAALFIREGLKVRAAELERLKGALNDVEQARRRLHDQARQVFGNDAE